MPCDDVIYTDIECAKVAIETYKVQHAAALKHGGIIQIMSLQDWLDKYGSDRYNEGFEAGYDYNGCD
jgi:hypothetical protein